MPIIFTPPTQTPAPTQPPTQPPSTQGGVTFGNQGGGQPAQNAGPQPSLPGAATQAIPPQPQAPAGDQMSNMPTGDLPTLALGYLKREHGWETDYGQAGKLSTWFRRVMGGFFDPQKWNPDQTPDQLRQEKARSDAIAASIVQKYPQLASSEDYIAAMMTAEQALRAPEIDPATGQPKPQTQAEQMGLGWQGLKRDIGIFPHVLGSVVNVAWTGALQVLSYGSKPFRAVWAGSQAVDDLTKDYGVGGDNVGKIGNTVIHSPFTSIQDNAQQLWYLSEIAHQRGMELQSVWGKMATVLSTVMPTLQPVMRWSVAEMFKNNGTDLESLRVQERQQSAGMVYSTILNEGRYQQFQQAIEGGMNQDLALEKYKNAWAEFGGDMVFDIFNMAGWFSDVGKVPKIRNAVDDFLKPADKGLETLAREASAMIASDGTTGAEAMTKFQEVGKGLASLGNDFVTKLINWSGDYSLFSPTAGAKAWAVNKRVGGYLDFVLHQAVREGGDATEAVDFLSQLTKLHLGTDAEKADAALALVHNSRFGQTVMSKAGIETGGFLARMLSTTDEAGKLVPSEKAISTFLDDLASNAGDGATLTEWMLKKYDTYIKAIYPSVQDMQRTYKAVKAADLAGEKVTPIARATAAKYEEFSGVYKVINTFEKSVLGKVYGPLNRGFALMYMGLSPGYAMRNALTNTVAMVADTKIGPNTPVLAAQSMVWQIAEGVRNWLPAAWRDGTPAQAAARQIIEMVDYLPEATFRGIGPAGGEDIGGAAKFLMNNMAQGMERGMSAMIVRDTIRDTLKSATRNGALPSIDSLVAGGLTEDSANLFYKMVLDNYGNTRRAQKAFMEVVDQGIVDRWRYAALPERFTGFLEQLPGNMLQRFEDLRHSAASKEEFVRGETDLWNEIRQVAHLGKFETPALPPESSDAKVAAAVDAFMSDLDKKLWQQEKSELFRQMVGSYRNARGKFSEAATQVIMRLRGDFRNALTDKEWEQVSSELSKGDGTMNQAAEAVNVWWQSVWEGWKVRANKASTPEELAQIWKEVAFQENPTEVKAAIAAGVEPAAGTIVGMGPVPENLDKETLLNQLFKFGRQQVSDRWYKANLDYKTASWKQVVGLMDEIMRRTGKTIEEVGLTQGEANLYREAHQLMAEGTVMRDARSAQHAAAMMRQALPTDFPAAWFKDGSDLAKETATLGDLHSFYLRAWGWEGGKQRILNAVNADRRAAGVAAEGLAKDFTDVTLSEALDALRKRTVGPNDRIPETLQSISKDIAQGGSDALDKWLYRNATGKERKAIEELQYEVGQLHNELKDAELQDAAIAGGKKQLASLEDELKALQNAVVERVTGETKLPLGKKGEGVPPISKADATKMLQEVENDLSAVISRTPENMPSIPRSILEQFDDFTREFKQVHNVAMSQWDVKDKVLADAGGREAMQAWIAEAEKRMTEVRLKAVALATEKRDFALHSYSDKTYMDLAISHIFPYQYWYNRSYQNWMWRALYRPDIIAAYGKYRRFMEDTHAGMPDWWKYQVSIDNLLGVRLQNPLYFNLEASLNPINGLTGIDFNDPNKRINWYTRMVDDMNKYGPSLFTPINWAVATALWMQGEKIANDGQRTEASRYSDAAQRWLGRLMPQTSMISTFLASKGIKVPVIGGYEVDPFVRIFMDGYDPYERRQIGRAMSTMVDTNVDGIGMVTQEMAMSADYAQSGPLWDAAVKQGMGTRFPGALGSFLGGAGFRQRTAGDMTVDQFYNDYFRVTATRSDLSPVDYQREMQKLRVRYPFMDTLLLSRKGSIERDSSYAYTILSRIPPGQSYDIFQAAGISSADVDRFYTDKGVFDTWSVSDSQRFMAGILDIAATMKAPVNSDRGEWITAKDSYQKMRDQITTQYGDAIWDNISTYLSTDTPAERDKFLQQHPEITMALDEKANIVMNDPLLYKYYGSIETYSMWQTSQMYTWLDGKYGADIRQKYSHYQDLKLTDPRAATAYYKANHLKEYGQDKAQFQANLNKQIVALYDRLAKPQLASLRQDWSPASPQSNVYQQQIAQTVNQPQVPSTQSFIDNGVPPELIQLVGDWYYNGADLPYAATSSLDYYASRLGYRNGDELLQLIGVSLRQPQQQVPQQAQQPYQAPPQPQPTPQPQQSGPGIIFGPPPTP